MWIAVKRSGDSPHPWVVYKDIDGHSGEFTNWPDQWPLVRAQRFAAQYEGYEVWAVRAGTPRKRIYPRNPERVD